MRDLWGGVKGIVGGEVLVILAVGHRPGLCSSPREIPRPAGEDVGLRDDAFEEGWDFNTRGQVFTMPERKDGSLGISPPPTPGALGETKFSSCPRPQGQATTPRPVESWFR